MVFTQSKMDSLKVHADSYFAHIAEIDAKISQFESSIKNSIGEYESKLVIYKSDPVIDSEKPEEEGVCSYKELAWIFFHGPLPGPYNAGFHLVLRSFKAKESEYDDSTKYTDKFVVKALFGSDTDKELAISKFDDFLDAFKDEIVAKIAKLNIK